MSPYFLFVWHGVLCCTLLLFCGCEAKLHVKSEPTESKPIKSTDYERGVNDALDCIALLNLEQELYRTNRTWGEMGAIVARRLSVARTNISELANDHH